METMQKVIKGILLTTLAITTTLYIAGCSQAKGNVLKEDANLTIEMPKENEQIEEIEDDIIGEKQPVSIKEQMTQGLSNLEIVKIKTAFPLMLDEMDRGQKYRLDRIILDLESMRRIVTFNPFKEDIEALQGLIQYHIDTGSLESLEYAMKMLNDLTLFGVDDPYDKKSPKAIEGWPIIFKEDKVFNVTKSLGNQYPPEIQEIINKANVTIDVSGNLRTDLIKKEEKIALELSKIKLENTQPLKEKSLQASELICDIRMSLIETDDKVEELKRLMDTNKETLVKLINECMGLLAEGNLKVEYSRILGYLEYTNEEIQKENFDYDLIVKCLDGSQESLDDISVVILGDVNPKVNKRYSAVLEMLEGNPVLYDWIKHELTGEYPAGGTPAKNYFGKVLYVDENDIELTSSEKLLIILDVQKSENLDKEKTIDLYGFSIPCYLIGIPEEELVDYKDTPYPYMKWDVDRNSLMILINDKWPGNDGETYRLENFLSLKFNKKIVQNIIERFRSQASQIIDPKDGTFILLSTATDDTRTVFIGSMEELQELMGGEYKKTPIYEIE